MFEGKEEKHGSWLDAAEIELSILTKQCLNRRLGDIETRKLNNRKWTLLSLFL